jgi:ribosome assembly protein 1
VVDPFAPEVGFHESTRRSFVKKMVLNEQQKMIRNICILAHVDHGKTTLADHLIAAAGGGVLHARQAGKLRYLDYRDDEQQRGVTMKSSSITLHFKNHVINLIDSPGHVDFCSEVSTAARLSDGALVLVDACEGVHIQTHAVLRQAWLERVTPCLVLNKMDRLILELKLTPLEAYARLQSIIGEVNNIINAFRSEKYLSDVDSILTGPTTPISEGLDSEDGHMMRVEEEEDEEDAFSPDRGNVAFTSAMDGFGFRIDYFADLYAAKLGANVKALRKALWGDHYYNPKTKKIVGKKAAAAGKLKPMFVQFVLEPLWQVYEVGMQGKDGAERLGKIIQAMNLSIPSRDLHHKDPKVVLQAVVSRWLPIADTVLSMVIECLPDPVMAQPERMMRLVPRPDIPPGTSKEVQTELELVRSAVEHCDGGYEGPCVAFVSKMFAVPIEALPRHGPNGEVITNLEVDLGVGDTDAAHRECFLAFARVFSGVLSVGQRVFVLSALYDPLDAESWNRNVQEARVEALYMMMGRGLEPKSSVSAGNVVAIRGLAQNILKSATLSTTRHCWPFASMTFQAAPIVRVAIEPSDPTDMGALTRGLRLLNRADPFVEVSVSGSGEHVIAAAGEVHLERCIKDLRERFARVELVVSPPLVAFRETVDAEGGTVDGVKTVPGQSEFVETTTPNGRCTVRVHVTRLPAAVTKVGGICKHKQSVAVLFFIVKCKSCVELMQCYLQSVVKFSLQSCRKCNT